MNLTDELSITPSTVHKTAATMMNINIPQPKAENFSQALTLNWPEYLEEEPEGPEKIFASGESFLCRFKR